MEDKEAMSRHQVKSRWYYIFWGIATVAVCAGQFYVGSGYKEMTAQQSKLSQSLQNLLLKANCQNE